MNPFSFIFGGGGAKSKAGGSYGKTSNTNIGAAAQSITGRDLTPGFNITKSAPFVGPTGGGGGQAATSGANQSAVTGVAAPDPYAAWGGQAAYNQATGQVDSGLNNIRQSGADAFGNAYRGLQGNLSDAIQGYKGQQTGIDNSRANNELNRLNGIQDILGYVRNGLQQGGSRLAASNATESSATGALQRAYQQLGSQKSRSVNSQAGLQSNQLDQSQKALTDNENYSKVVLQRNRDNAVNTIGTDLRDQLSKLDQQAQGLNLAGRIQVDQEKQSLVDKGLAQLQELDQWYAGQLSGVAPQTQDQVIAAAQGLRSAGTALSNPFADQLNFDQQQVQGPAVNQLPLFTRNKKITA